MSDQPWDEHSGPPGSTVWLDVSAGVAGDMLLAALLDLGASMTAVAAAVESVVPGEVTLRRSEVTRAALRACRIEVLSQVEDHPHRSWAGVRAALAGAGLTRPVHERAVAVFTRLAEAEARVHGIPVDDVSFHEVGAWDSIADVVGVCAALDDLGVEELLAGPVAVGSGHVLTAHGRLPVPVPAVLELARGREVHSGGIGELATPTGMAVLAALSTATEAIPTLRVAAIGIGAGSRDMADHANVVRAVLAGQPASRTDPRMYLLETNVDDLDPRLWPQVLADLLDGGAADAWLVPILMKKGRPAHTLCVLTSATQRATLRERMFASTTTLGVRETPVARIALDRAWRTVDVEGGSVRIKLGLRGGYIVQASPEYSDVEDLARTRGVPVRQVLREAEAGATVAGLTVGSSEVGGEDPPERRRGSSEEGCT